MKVKYFIYRLFLFVFILVFANLILNFLTQQFLYQKSVFNKTEQQLADYDGKIRFLITGDSHLQNSINPLIFKNSFNYSSSDENYIQTYYKLKSLIERNYHLPENVILVANPSSFCSFKMKRFRYDSYWVNFVDYFEVAKSLKRPEFLIKWFTGKYVSYAGNGLQIIQYFVIKNLLEYSSELYLGYRPRYQDLSTFSEQRVEKNISRKFLYYKFFPGYFDDDLVDYFERTLRLCKDNNINVILLRVPISRRFYERSNNELFRIDDVYDKLELITDKYPEIIHLDYLTLFFDHPEYFWSADHINDKGATVLSEILNDTLNSDAF